MTEFSKSDIFLSSKNATYSYQDLESFTRFFAKQIGADAIKNKQPISFLSDSTDELVLAIAACWKLGVPINPLNPNIDNKNLQAILTELKPTKIFCNFDNFQKISVSNKVLLNSEFLNTTLKQKISSKEHPILSNNSETDIFGYFLTSGTTGNSKIVPLKRRQLVSAATSSAHTFKPDSNHFWLLCLPLNHIGGISIILRSLLYGSAVYRMDSFDEQIVTKFLGSDVRFQAVSLVPTMLLRLLKNIEFKTHNTFKAILLGGGPSNAELINKTIDRKISIILSYGMTETCAQIITNPIMSSSDSKKDPTSVGIPFSPNKLDIRNETGVSVDEHKSGSVWLKGPQVFDGYYNPLLNETVFDDDNWFNTGDYGHLNEFGNLVIESRRVDIIITGGENVVPTEVENVISKHPSVNEVVVIGIKDDEWGQKVLAVITTHNNSTLTIDDLQEFLKPTLQSFKIPKALFIVDELPKTALGKIKRTELIERYNSN